MRSAAVLLSLVSLKHIASVVAEYSPFSNPLFGLSEDALIVKRQNSCQAGYNSCSRVGDKGACCPVGQNCVPDEAGQIACCPTSASCTGTISGTGTANSISSTLSSGGVVISTTTSAYSGTTTSGASIDLPSGTGVLGGGSTVPNAFYPFIYIPTSYATPSLCLTAYSYCQSQSTACFASLGGVNGVTVSGYGGGITIGGQASTTVDAASASSVCSSLSSQACYNINQASCGAPAGNTGTVTGSATFIQNGMSGPRQTPCPGIIYAAGAGALMGGLGALL